MATKAQTSVDRATCPECRRNIWPSGWTDVVAASMKVVVADGTEAWIGCCETPHCRQSRDGAQFLVIVEDSDVQATGYGAVERATEVGRMDEDGVFHARKAR